MSAALQDEKPNLLAILERMLLARRFEEAVYALRREGQFGGHYHLYIGQEATGAAAMAALAAEDSVFTTHRNHGHLICRGADPGRALAEILGRAGGLNGGRGGTFHLADPALGIPHTSALVGGSVPLAAGAAWAMKLAATDSVAVAFFGDAALEEGVVFETLNAAKLWRLPAIFICENNDPASPDGGSATLTARRLADVADALKIESLGVDGGTVDTVFGAVAEARRTCRAGDGPVFIEALTEPWPGNRGMFPDLVTGVTDVAMAWDTSRIGGPHAAWFAELDPVLRAARTAIAAGLADADAILARDAAARRRIETARAFALASPWPDPATVARHVVA